MTIVEWPDSIRMTRADALALGLSPVPGDDFHWHKPPTFEQTCANCTNYLTEDGARKRLAAKVEVANFLYKGKKARERKEWRQTGCMAIFAVILLAAVIVAALTGAIVI